MGTQEAPLLLLQFGAPDLNEPHVSLLPIRHRCDQRDQYDKGTNKTFLLERGRGQVRVHSELPPASQENRCSAAVNGINNTQIRTGSGTLPPSCWTHTT